MNALSGSFIVLANSFNPSIVSQAWLIDQGLAQPGEFGDTSISTPGAAHHQFARGSLLVAPDRLQMTFRPDDDDAVERAHRLVSGIARALPHTPFIALGMNFDYGIELELETFSRVVRRMFLVQDGPLAQHFDAGDALFGGYFSRDFQGTRFRLDVKPVRSNEQQPNVSRLGIACNFHLGVDRAALKQPPDLIQETLNGWKTCRQFAVAIVASIEAFAGGSAPPSED